MTRNIMAKTLELAGYKNVDNICDICDATPNPEVALEMLLDVYLKPNVEDERHLFYSNKGGWNNAVYKLSDIDELQDTVLLMKYIPKMKRIWFASEEDRKNNVYSDERIENAYTDTQIVAGTGFTKELITEKSAFLTSIKEIGEAEFNGVLTQYEPQH
jgi:hypothetical protein